MSDKDAREEAARNVAIFMRDLFGGFSVPCLVNGVEGNAAFYDEPAKLLQAQKVLEGFAIRAAESQRTQAPSGPWMKDAPKDMATLQQTGNDRELKLREHNTEGMLGRHAGTQAPSEHMKLLNDLDYFGIYYDAELAKEGWGWEVAAEPLPQQFATFRDAMKFRDQLTAGTQAQAAQWISVNEDRPDVDMPIFFWVYSENKWYAGYFRTDRLYAAFGNGEECQPLFFDECEVSHYMLQSSLGAPVALEGKKTNG